jgi:hypothetical protein
MVVRTSEGTTAMMLPPVRAEAPSGVRVYLGQPEVQDKTERGAATAYRKVTIKYQFERAGTYTLPELTFAWWDPNGNELRQQTLPEMTLEVTGPSPTAEGSPEEPSDNQIPWGKLAVVLVVAGGLGWLLRAPFHRLWANWVEHHNRPEAVAVRQMKKACSTGNAAAAYAAMLRWYGSQSQGRDPGDGPEGLDAFLRRPEHRQLYDQWLGVSKCLFSEPRPNEPWHGTELWSASEQVRQTRREVVADRSNTALPELNP